jgi:hypothetical protein
MKGEIDEMDPELRGLLDAERDRPGPSTADRDALRAGLGSLLDPGGGGGGSGSGSGGSGGGAATSTAATAGGSALAKLAAVFVAGAVAGGAVVWGVAPRTVIERVPSAPVTVTVPATVTSEGAAPIVEPSATPSASVSVARIAPIAPAKSTPGASVEKRDEDLASERALLERARVALGRGDATGALEALDRHAARHPSGRLAEEREVLAVQALVSAGRKDEANARAARFHREHPSSAFGSAVDALVR